LLTTLTTIEGVAAQVDAVAITVRPIDANAITRLALAQRSACDSAGAAMAWVALGIDARTVAGRRFLVAAASTVRANLPARAGVVAATAMRLILLPVETGLVTSEQAIPAAALAATSITYLVVQTNGVAGATMLRVRRRVDASSSARQEIVWTSAGAGQTHFQAATFDPTGSAIFSVGTGSDAIFVALIEARWARALAVETRLPPQTRHVASAAVGAILLQVHACKTAGSVVTITGLHAHTRLAIGCRFSTLIATRAAITRITGEGAAYAVTRLGARRTAANPVAANVTALTAHPASSAMIRIGRSDDARIPAQAAAPRCAATVATDTGLPFWTLLPTRAAVALIR
jgi:hypothetical protein